MVDTSIFLIIISAHFQNFALSLRFVFGFVMVWYRSILPKIIYRVASLVLWSSLRCLIGDCPRDTEEYGYKSCEFTAFSPHNQINQAWWRHQMETLSALLALCAGNSLVTCEFPSQRPVTRSFDVFSDLRLNKCLSKQPRGWWFETPSRLLWLNCNEGNIKMTSQHGNTFHNSGRLWGESTSQGTVIGIFEIFSLLIWAKYWLNNRVNVDLKCHVPNMPSRIKITLTKQCKNYPCILIWAALHGTRSLSNIFLFTQPTHHCTDIPQEDL